MQITLQEDFGGVTNFSSKADAILWAQRQAKEWLEAFDVSDNSIGHNIDKVHPTARLVYGAWKSLEFSLSTIGDLEFATAPLFGGRVQDNLIMASAPAGKALHWVNNNLDNDALSAAFATAKVSHLPINWSESSSTAGVVHYIRIMNAYRDFDEAASSNGVKIILSRAEAKAEAIGNSVSDVEGRLGDIKDDINEIRENYSKKYSEVYSSGVEQLATIHERNVNELSDKYDDAKRALANFEISREKGISELENWRAAFREEVRLEPAARLWTGLAKLHSTSATHSGIASIVVGVSGIILTPVIAIQIMKWIRQKFSEIGGDGLISGSPSRAAELTFHYQIAFSAAVTLLWLTMFLWLMRVLVRRHTMQRRLHIDAAGRAALTQTYLGLIQDGAVNENERPIVLASLFLPVSDNSVDDGPPATSLASILAAIAAGKAGVG